MKAFPTHKEEGMELRDYFAAKIMQGLVANANLQYGDRADSDDEVDAKRAYKRADAMMKAREKK
jgi:hypothetical protein